MIFRFTNISFAFMLAVVIAYDWQNHVPIIVYLILLFVCGFIIFWGTVTLSAQFFAPAKCEGEKLCDCVALTFDDGPDPEATTETLNILRNHSVKATFFCIGKNVKANPELTKRIIEEGHIIGNHSFYHGTWFDLQSQKLMRQEIMDANTVIEEITGKRPRLFRPPYGVMNPMLAGAIKESGMVTIGWSVRSFDTVTSNKNKLINRITKNLKGGDVILFHDRCNITREILPELLSLIIKSGLKIDTLDNVLKEKAYA